MTPLEHALVPVATESDAEATVRALEPSLEAVERVTAVHVIEKAGGAPDKAPLEKRQADAEAILDLVTAGLADRAAVDTRIAYGTDVVATLFAAADDAGATAIVIRPRGGSRIVQLLTGDTATRLVTESEIPVVSLPDPNDA